MQRASRRQLTIASAFALGVPLLVLFALLAREGFKRLFMGMAKFVVGGVKDHLPLVVAVSVVALVLVWAIIIARSVYEARAEAHSQTATGD